MSCLLASAGAVVAVGAKAWTGADVTLGDRVCGAAMLRNKKKRNSRPSHA